MEMYVLIVGNILDGIRVIGPFKTKDDAILYTFTNNFDDAIIAPMEGTK